LVSFTKIFALTKVKLGLDDQGVEKPVVSRVGARKLFFFIIRGANHANLYKNLIKFQISNVNLGTIGGPSPCPPLSTPLVVSETLILLKKPLGQPLVSIRNKTHFIVFDYY